MTNQPTTPVKPTENTQVSIPCANCKAVNPMEKMINQQPIKELPGVVDHGLLCPDCGNWTHSYYMTAELATRRDRLEVLHRLFNAHRTQGHWTTYDTAQKAYKAEFEKVQDSITQKRRAKERG